MLIETDEEIGLKRTNTPKWKFCIVVWLGIFPAVLFVSSLIHPFTTDWELWQRVLLITLFEVPFSVWVSIPVLQYIFREWLDDGTWENMG